MLEEEYVFLSKYFGQSELNVQGQGGNISIKDKDKIIIKSSGFVLGNTKLNEGYCYVDYEGNVISTRDKPSESRDKPSESRDKPSMETYFHLFTMKYTIHLHFLLSNYFFTQKDSPIELKNFKYKYIIIDYYKPGKILADKIKEKYNNEPFIFLKNHGIIINCNNYDEIFIYYEYLFDYFNQLLGNKYEKDCFNICKIIYDKFKIPTIVKKINFPQYLLKGIKYCFPDLVVYIQSITDENKICDVLFYNNNVYIIATSITNFYCKKEILKHYKKLNYENLIQIDKEELLNMEEEKFRKNI